MIHDVHPGSRIRFFIFTHSWSRIQGSKRHRIPDPDPQHYPQESRIRIQNTEVKVLVSWLIVYVQFRDPTGNATHTQLQKEFTSYLGTQRLLYMNLQKKIRNMHKKKREKIIAFVSREPGCFTAIASNVPNALVVILNVFYGQSFRLNIR